MDMFIISIGVVVLLVYTNVKIDPTVHFNYVCLLCVSYTNKGIYKTKTEDKQCFIYSLWKHYSDRHIFRHNRSNTINGN